MRCGRVKAGKSARVLLTMVVSADTGWRHERVVRRVARMTRRSEVERACGDGDVALACLVGPIG